jgi:hypothetical protein
LKFDQWSIFLIKIPSSLKFSQYNPLHYLFFS